MRFLCGGFWLPREASEGGAALQLRLSLLHLLFQLQSRGGGSCLHFTTKYRLAGVIRFGSFAEGLRGLEAAQSGVALAVWVYPGPPVT